MLKNYALSRLVFIVTISFSLLGYPNSVRAEPSGLMRKIRKIFNKKRHYPFSLELPRSPDILEQINTPSTNSTSLSHHLRLNTSNSNCFAVSLSDQAEQLV